MPVARRVTLAVLVALLLGVVVAAALVANDALAARQALTAAADRVPALEAALTADGDKAATPALTAELAAFQRDAHAAKVRSDGPLWWLAGRLPAVGPDLDAVTRISATLDGLASQVAPALLDARAAVSRTGRSADGAVDVSALSALAHRVSAARAEVTASQASLARVDGSALIPAIATPWAQLRGQLDDVAVAVTSVDRATTLVPAMIGADGPRTYLVLAMTNAELRSGGGVPGAVLLVKADRGKVSVVKEVAGVDLGPFQPVAKLDPESQAVFSQRPATFVQDVTETPEFPTSAQLAAAMWAKAEGDKVDGVIATDPVALSYLLKVTGPVDVPVPDSAQVVTLSADDAVPVLEHDVYAGMNLAAHQADAFFGSVVSAAAARLTDAHADPAALVAALAQGAAEHRVLVWSARPAEEKLLAATVVGGAFLSSPRAADAVGVFVDDSIAGKMSWYLDSKVELVQSQCTPAGRVDTIDVTLKNTAPADAGATLPWYVAGIPDGTFTPGDLRLVLRAVGPQGSPTPRLGRDGHVFGMDTYPLAGRSIASGTITLAPGQSTTVQVQALASHSTSLGGGPQPTGTLDIWSTPTARSGGLQTVPAAVCPTGGADW